MNKYVKQYEKQLKEAEEMERLKPYLVGFAVLVVLGFLSLVLILDLVKPIFWLLVFVFGFIAFVMVVLKGFWIVGKASLWIWDNNN